jgi:DNA-binding transcriptional ArsR family regulator
MTTDSDDSFNASRAEVFEALGHPTRIRILQTLSQKSLSYADLKRGTGIESNGLLAFHLGKLAGLVKQNAEGDYALTDEGREALRISEVSKGEVGRAPKTGKLVRTPLQKAILAGLIIGLVVLGSVAVYQQGQMNAIPHASQSDASSTVLVYGTIGLNATWVSGIQGGFHVAKITFTSTNATYSVSPSTTGQYWVMLPAGQSYTTTVSYVGNGTCQNCLAIISEPPTNVKAENATGTPGLCLVSGCPKPPDQTFTLEVQVLVHGPGQGTSVTASGLFTSKTWELYSNSTTFNYSPWV